MAHLQAWAIGVDRPQTLSALGQPLNLSFAVRLNEGEAINPECVLAEVLAGETRLPSSAVQLRLEGDSETSVRAVRLQTTVQIDEPLVMVKLSVGCPVRFVRQYTAFVDPPGLQQLMAAAPAPALVEPASRSYSPALRAALATSQARPSVLLAPQPLPAETVALPAVAASSPRSGSVASSGLDALPAGSPPQPAQAAPSSKQLAAKDKAERRRKAKVKSASAVQTATGSKTGGRLQLEPSKLELTAAQVLASAPAAPSAPAEAALPEAAARRLAELESGLQQMKTQQRDTQAQLTALRAQFEHEQAAKFQNPLVYGLGLLSLVLGLASLYLWRARHGERAQHENAWWNDARELQTGKTQSTVHAVSAEPAVGLSDKPVAPAWEAGSSTAPRTATAAATGPDPADGPATVAWSQPRSTPAPVSFGAAAAFGVTARAESEPESEPLRIQLLDTRQDRASGAKPAAVAPPVTVEALIDLEQQVQFFLLLGQDDAAAELLERRLQSGLGGLAWPYLRLLEIHQRRGDAAAFAVLAERLSADLGIPAPAFDAPLGQGEGVQGRAELLALLQAGWQDSGASMALLQRLLTERAAAGAEAPILDLASYHDLLLLYGVARDLSEHEVRGEQIDVFLPLDGAAAGSASMMATMPWQAAAGAVHTPRTLAVDISLDEVLPTEQPGAGS